MDDPLERLQRWAHRRSMRQLYTELDTHLPKDAYELELEGDTLTVYRFARERGLLGIGRRRVRQPCLQAIRHNDRIEIPQEGADPGLLALLDRILF